MPKRNKKTKEAARPDDWWVGGPHPRGGRSGPLVDSLEEESGLSRIFQEEEEEDYEVPTPREPSADVVRRLTSQPVCVNLSDLFRETMPGVSILDKVDEDDVLGGLYEEEEMDAEDEVGDGDDDDDHDEEDDEDDDEDDEQDKEELVAAGSEGAASVSLDAANAEEVATSTSYAVVRPETTVVLRDVAVQTARGVSSLQKTLENKEKKKGRRRAKKRKAKSSLPTTVETSTPAVAAPAAVTERAPPTSAPPTKRQRSSIPDARSRIDRRHAGDYAYGLDRMLVGQAKKRGLSLTRQQRVDYVYKNSKGVVKPILAKPETPSTSTASPRPVPDVRRESGAIPKRKPAMEEAAASTSSSQLKKRRTKPKTPIDHTPASLATTTRKATEGSVGSISSVADRKREELEKIEELQRQLLAAHQRIARLDFESSAAAVAVASSLSLASSPATHPASLPGAKGRKK